MLTFTRKTKNMQYVIGLLNCLDIHTSYIRRNTFPRPLKHNVYFFCLHSRMITRVIHILIAWFSKKKPQNFRFLTILWISNYWDINLSAKFVKVRLINIFGCIAFKSKMFTRCIYEIRIVKLKFCKYMTAYIYF